MKRNRITKPKNVNYFRVPRRLWRRVKKHLPKPPQKPGPRRPHYARKRYIRWKWQSIDSKSCASPLGGEQSGKNPTDRGKQGSKIHIVVDQRGAPLSLHVTGANEHGKWSADDLIFSVAARRPSVQQHLCADKGYDFTAVCEVVRDENYIPHIKPRHKRGDPPDPCPIPGEYGYPARR